MPITYRDFRQKRLAFYVHVRDGLPIRDDRSWLTFSHGIHACSPFFYCGAEMFFSLFFLYLSLLFRTLWGAKVLIIFGITKKLTNFHRKKTAFLQFICNFASLL